MNFKNYKLEALTIIDEYKKEQTSENGIIQNSVDEIEEAIKLLDDQNCLNTEFLDNIWTYYCKDLPYTLSVALFNYTSFKSQTICWEIPTNPDIIFIETLSYKINLPSDKVKDIIKPQDKIFYDILEIPIIFDFDTKKWYVTNDTIFGLSNTYSLDVAKRLCKIQFDINEEEKKAKLLVKQAAEEAKKKEKERIKEEKRKAKELEKERKRQEKLKKSISEGTEKQKASNKKKALKQLKSNAIQSEIKF